jgi:signal transduction histidine kinase
VVPYVVLAFAGAALAVVASLCWFLVARERVRRAILDRGPDGVLTFASATAAGRASASLAGLLGLDEGAPTPDLVANAFADPDRGRLLGAIDRLRTVGEPFDLALAHADDRPFLVSGRRIAGRDVVWFRHVGAAVEAARLALARDPFREILEALPFPVWRRAPDRSLSFCNRAYAEAVEAPEPAEAVARGVELVGAAGAERARALAAESVELGGTASAEIPAVIGGRRRLLSIVESALAGGDTVGSAQDVTERDSARRDLERHLQAQSEVMANLKTPIAILGPDKRLKFFNDAYAAMWRLDPAWLAEEPSYGELLDAMRERRLLPELADFRAYKRKLLEEFETATEPVEDVLHRPDGSTTRITMTPHPLGGMVFLYEDVTDRLALERSLNTQIAVQRATLDNLFEAVAVFGSDGRLKLSNPGFARLWRLPEPALAGEVHIGDVLEWTKELYDYGADWETYKAGIVAQIAERTAEQTRLERTDGVVLEIASVPLPDGATLMTYVDVTDSIVKERALTERTEALETADRLKSEFIANISYELRTPLNTIAGFSEILANQYFGGLNERQLEYCRGVIEASNQLAGTINDILDLASIEAGHMSLHLERFDIHQTVAGMIAFLQRRARLERLVFAWECPVDIGAMVADQRRIKQVIFNLLSNAFKFTPAGGRVSLAVAREGEDVTITVADTGIGIHRDEQARVFDRFQRGRAADRYSGTGLGLSLVKSFVELHGGGIALHSEPSAGTRIVCRIPAKPPKTATLHTVHAA